MAGVGRHANRNIDSDPGQAAGNAAHTLPGRFTVTPVTFLICGDHLLCGVSPA